jgi:hypothetical protein
MSKTLVLYVFHVYNTRVKYFINNCIFKDENVDFIIISNDKTNAFEAPDYIKVLFRENIGYDFGGWSDALLTNNLYENYDKFVFVNSSVVGPFVPSYYKGRWTDIYTDGLTDNIKLFGSTINTCSQPLTMSHVQTYVFALDKDALKYLIECEIFTTTKYVQTMHDAVHQKEILMSRKIIENNWNIGSLLRYYKNVDFRFINKKPEEYNMDYLHDVMYPQFRNVYWNEYDVVFLKGNRINLGI